MHKVNDNHIVSDVARMDMSDPSVVGFKMFLFWTAVGLCCFLLATAVAWLLSPSPSRRYSTRLIVMFAIFAALWIYVPATVPAFTGNSVDPQNANRHARWEARNAGRLYGMHTFWPWCLIALLHRPKPTIHEPQSR